MGAYSLLVERFINIEEVGGLIPTEPTKNQTPPPSAGVFDFF